MTENMVREMAAELRAEGIAYAEGDTFVMAYPRDLDRGGDRVIAAAARLGLRAEHVTGISYEIRTLRTVR